jgi:hydroxymethylpyrimidine/phosphomethylpyrimidine kinase
MHRSKRIRPICALTIAGSDSGGGAGIQADLLTFAAHGIYGATVVIAGTAQNTRGVVSVESFSPRFIAEQMDAVFSDLAPAAVKVGMLCDARQVRTVASGLRRHRARNVVLDPVIRATSGTELLSPAGVRAVVRELLPLCDLVTPNLDEAAALAGMEIRSAVDQESAARRIAELGARAVLVKGGHRPGERIRDALWDGEQVLIVEGRRIPTAATHGTGCTLSAAIAAGLALGLPLRDAVAQAVRYVRRALKRGVFPGEGVGVPGRVPARLTPRGRTGTRATSKRSPRSRSARRRGRRRVPGPGSYRSP